MTIRSYQLQVQVLVSGASAGSTIVRSVSESLGLTEAAETDTTYLSVDEDLGLAESTAVVIILPGGQYNVVESLGLTELAVNTGQPDVIEALGLSEVVAVELVKLNFSVSEPMNLTESVSFGFSVRNLSVEEDLNLTEQVGREFSGAVAESLGLTEFASFTDVVEDLGLTEVVSWGYGIDVEEDLDLTEEIDLDKILNPLIVDDLGLTESAAYFIESRCGRFEYQSFEGTGGITPVDQKLNYRSGFLMQSLDDGTTVELRNPETDDRRRLAFNRVSRNFFDGTADVYSDPNWVIEESQIYTLVATKRADLDTIQNFLLDNLGREVLLKDWKGVTWIVIVTNPGELHTEDGEGYWTIDFEVDGEAIDGEYVFDRMDPSEIVSRAGSIWNRSASDSLALVEAKGYERDIPPIAETITWSESATFVVETP